MRFERFVLTCTILNYMETLCEMCNEKQKEVLNRAMNEVQFLLDNMEELEE